MKNKQPARKVIFGIMLMLLISGCSLHQPTIKEPPVVPTGFQHQNAGNAVKMPIDPWWQSFNDPQLSHLIATAFAGNLDLDQDSARYQ
jgi:outer membrane protein TolC